jgi:regulator of RNase E activity RraA
MGENDVVVVNIFGKIKEGSFIGDNLTTAIASLGATGMVIDGAIRDPGGIYDVPNINVFCRGFDPGVVSATLISWNGPTRIGQATVLPGDVVLGTRVGVTFIPPHLVEEVVTASKNVRLHDIFRQQRLRERKYIADEVYIYKDGIPVWSDEIEADFQEWCKQRQGESKIQINQELRLPYLIPRDENMSDLGR